MNRKNLDLIVEQYVNHFEELNDRDGDDEGYKWRAESSFKANWDINSDDFAEMFRSAMKDISNLTDQTSAQSVEGIQLLLENEEEIPFVQACFRDLFVDDEGDLSERQMRIRQFCDKMNQRISHVTGESTRYEQTMTSGICYLNLWQPEENYMYRQAEADAWAKCIDFKDKIGSGSKFSLERYYKMCNELLEELGNYEDLLSLNTRRMEEMADGYDDENHILVYDLIYCAYTHDFYAGMNLSIGTGEKERRDAQNEKEISRIQKQIAEAQEKLSQLEAASVSFPDLTGTSVTHKKFGEGTVVSCAEGKLRVDFGGMEKVFQYPQVFQQGFLTCKSKKNMNLFMKSGETEKQKTELSQSLLLLRMELSKLEK